MHDSTLLLTLRLFSPAERQLLDYFVASPLFKLGNRHQDAVALWAYLKETGLDDAAQLDRATVALMLLGHRANPEAELRKAMSNLNQIVRKLILFQSVMGLEGSPLPAGATLAVLQQDAAMLDFLVKRSADQVNAPKAKQKRKQEEVLIQQTHKAITAKLNALGRADMQTLDTNEYRQLLLLRIQTAATWQDITSASISKGTKSAMDYLAILDESFRMLQYDARLNPLAMHLSGRLALSPDSSTLQDLFHLPPPSISQRVYFDESEHFFQTLIAMLGQRDLEPGIKAFLAFEVLLHNALPPLPKAIIQSAKALTRLYCGVMTNQHGSVFFQQKRFDLFREHIEEDMLLHHGQVSAIQLSGLISDALRLGGYVGWVADFLQQFEQGRGIISTQTPREVYKINVANLRFHQQQYREAANELIGYEWYGRVDDPQLLLLAIRIDLKARYELGLHDDDHTTRTLDAAEKRITRLTDIAPPLSQMTLHFLRIIKQLSHIQQKRQLKHPKKFDATPKCQQLRTAIHDKPTAEKAWLLAKIAELEG